MKKVLASVAPALFVWMIVPTLTFAQDTFNSIDPNVVDGVITNTKQSGFIPCSGTNCSPCDLVVLFNTVLEWFLSISFLLFAVLAMIAGIKMVTAQGSVTLGEAKKSFTNAFIGLIIILSAWLLVDTIMRGVVKGNGTIDGYGPWTEVKCATQNEVDVEGGLFEGDPEYVQGLINATPSGTTIIQSGGCTGGTCVRLTIPCSNNNSCSIAPDLVEPLARMHQQANVNGARVSEAMPPTRRHRDSCHTTGKCIDYSKQGGMSPSEVKRVIDAAYANGLRPSYEVQTQAQKNTLVSGGVPSANILVLGSHISAPHFSIYGK